MNSKIQKALFQTVTLVVTSLAAGCVYDRVEQPAGLPVSQISVRDAGAVTGTGIESQDLVAVTDKMAASLLTIPQITNTVGTPCVVLDPIENNTPFPIKKDIFLDRIQAELIRKASGRVTFLARDRMLALQHEQDLKRSGQVTASSDPRGVEFKGADFFLTGKLDSITTQTGAGRSDYVLYSFQLVDARTSAIVWGDSAEIKKQGQSDAAYR